MLPSFQSVPVTLVAVMCAIAGTISAFAPFFSLPPDYRSRRAAPAGIALATSVASVAGFVVPLLISRVVTSTDFSIGEYMIGSLMIAGALVLVLLFMLSRRPAALATEAVRVDR